MTEMRFMGEVAASRGEVLTHTTASESSASTAEMARTEASDVSAAAEAADVSGAAEAAYASPTEPATDMSASAKPASMSRVSRPAEFHHRPLAEPSVRLSPHSAPIRQTCRSYRSASVQRGPRFLGRAS